MPDSAQLTKGINTSGRVGTAKVNDWASDDTRIL